MILLRVGLGITTCAWLFALAAVSRECLAVDAPASTPTDSPPPISWTGSAIVAKPGEPRGYVLFQRACSVCHGTGPAKPGTRALTTKYHGKLPALLEQRTDLQPDYIKYIVRHGVSVMAPFRKTELSDADLDAIADYLTRRHGR
jgi:(+)-pinoresinol hydroxylase